MVEINLGVIAITLTLFFFLFNDYFYSSCGIYYCIVEKS